MIQPIPTLPTRLKHEPIIDAIFEVRFDGAAKLADILPGMLFSYLDPKPNIHRQPAAEIPQPLRATDPNLIFAPVIQLELERFTISVGERNVIVGCKLPYPAWAAFKSQILNITKALASLGVDANVERYSIKYVNLVPADSYSEQISKVEMSLHIGGIDVVNNHLNLQVHHIDDEILHIFKVVTGANVSLSTGEQRTGVVVDVDSIRNIEPLAYRIFAEGLELKLETLRQSNKEKFFSCLKSETIEAMGPIYDE